MPYMFERFTDRARRALALAQEEAKELNHDYIGTEHILLGLVREGEGVAARALESMGLRLADLRHAVTERVGPRQSAGPGAPGFTPRAKKVLELSLREALRLGHNYIGTEHMLLGLVAEGEGVAAKVLADLGVGLDRVRSNVLDLLRGHSAQLGGGATGPARELAWGPDDPPRCATCGAKLALTARYRDIAVQPAEGAREGAQVPVLRVVFCSTCGTAVGLPASPVVQAVATLHRSPAPPAQAAPVGRPFPDEQVSPVDLKDVPEGSRVELTWTDKRILDGQAAGSAVQLLGHWSHEGSLEGAWGGEPLAVSWRVAPSGATPAPTGDLTGSYGAKRAELYASLRLGPTWLFETGELTGQVSDRELSVQLVRAPGGLGGHTVSAVGKLASASFQVFVSVSEDHSRAVARGSVDGQRVALDFGPSAGGGPLPIAGDYKGPAELLALLVCATLYFIA